MNLRELLPEANFLGTVQTCIIDAYRQNAPLQMTELGHGDYTYSHTNCKTIQHFLKERLGKGAEVTVLPEGNSVHLLWEGRLFYVNKFGRSEHDDPWESTPGRPGAAGRANERQLQLPFEVERASLPVLVVGHYGCLATGLRAIRIHQVGSVRDGEIQSWADYIDLWLAADAVPDDLPAAVEVAEPELEVRRHPAREEKAAGGQE